MFCLRDVRQLQPGQQTFIRPDTTTSFHIPSTSLVTNHPSVDKYIRNKRINKMSRTASEPCKYLGLMSSYYSESEQCLIGPNMSVCLSLSCFSSVTMTLIHSDVTKILDQTFTVMTLKTNVNFSAVSLFALLASSPVVRRTSSLGFFVYSVSS